MRKLAAGSAHGERSSATSLTSIGLSLAEVREVLGAIRSLCVTHTLTVEHHDRGSEIAERYRFSFYDSVIVASALLAGCKTLYSEDLQHGQCVEQLKVINPFSKSRLWRERCPPAPGRHLACAIRWNYRSH